MNRTSALIGLLAAGLATVAQAGDTARASLGDTRLTAGDDVIIDEQVEGHAFVAAARVDVRAAVERSAFLTGGDVTVSGPIGRNLYAAGGDIRLEGTVGGKLRAAGGKIQIARGARVEGRATVAGGKIEVDGEIDDDLRAFGESIVINGVVDGDAKLAAESIRIGPEARISGRLDYRSGAELKIDPAAQIADGTQEFRESERSWARRAFHGSPAFGSVNVSLGMVILGAILILAAPRFSRESAGLVRSQPWQSVGTGFVMLIGVPFVIMVLLITIIGIPLALLMIFGYLVLLLLGYLIAAIFVGDLALGRISAARLESPWWRVLAMLLALIALAIVRQVPLVGGLAVAILFCVGIGAFTIRSWRGLRPSTA